MAKKNIHVHVHERPAPTRDSDGEGKWVTINGAHVMIGEGGKITKGPAALVGKSEHTAHAEHHEAKADEHRIAAKEKGKEHPDHALHKKAAGHHDMAAKMFRGVEREAEAGNMVASGAAARAGHTEAKKADEAGAKLSEQHKAAAAAESKKPFVPPPAHEALHEEAAQDVKGSEKHKAEHNRLLNLYHTSSADWQRTATNRLIQNNATAAVQQNAQRLHHTALAASEHAKRTGAAADHHVASQHIQSAIDAHGRAGGVGYAAKQAELAKMKKGHDAEVSKASKASPAAAISHDGTVKKHKAEGDAHEDVGRRGADIKERGFVHQKSDTSEPGRTVHHYAHPDGSTAALIHQKVDNGYEPARHEVSSLVNTMNQGKKPGGAYPGKGNAYINDPSKPLPRRTTPIAGDQRHDFTRAHGASTAALDKIAARVAKKAVGAAEDAADQDPKHKK